MLVTCQIHRLFAWQVVRNVRRHPLLAALNICGIALGVAVFTAIRLTNASATTSFRAAVDLVAGSADLEIRGRVPEDLLPLIAAHPGVRAATPLVETHLPLPDHPGKPLHLLGLEPLTGAGFHTLAASSRDLDESWFADPAGIALSSTAAAERDLQIGDPLRVSVNGELRYLTVRSILDEDEQGAAFGLMDIGWAQELIRSQGRLTTILIQIEPGTTRDAVAASLDEILPADQIVRRPSFRTDQVDRMLSSFRLNLTALSLVSMLVGLFLIYNTLSASVVRSRLEIGILRAIGASREEIRALFLGETLLYAIAGSLLGLLLGRWLAGALLHDVERTISSLYVLTRLRAVPSDPVAYLAGFFLGTGSALLAAWIPSGEASNTAPASVLATGNLFQAPSAPSRISTFRLLQWPAVLLASSIVASLAAFHVPHAGFVAAFLCITGVCALSPALITAFGAFWQRLTPPHPALRLSGDNLLRSRTRNSTTLAALAAAIAMMAGLTIMIHSFRTAVDDWIQNSMRADLFVTLTSGDATGVTSLIPPNVVDSLRLVPGIEEVATYRQTSLPTRSHGDLQIAVVRGKDRSTLRFLSGNPTAIMEAFLREPDACLITEALSRRLELRVADTLDFLGPGGVVPFRVVGIYRDYSSDQGLVAMQAASFESHWDEARAQSLALYLTPGEDLARTKRAVEAAINSDGQYAIYANRELRQRVLEIFDQTFAVTHVLRTVAVAVAVLGVLLALTIHVMERRREFALLRAIGGSRGQVQSILIAEALWIGALATLLGLAGGLALSVILTDVINKAFFGWTIPLLVPWTWLMVTPLWILPAAALAAWFPARACATFDPAPALRAE